MTKKERAGKRDSDVASDLLYVAESETHGLGLFAKRHIKEDVVLGRLLGMPTYDEGMYVLWITDELGLEITNDFRFINHDNSANCALSDIDVVTTRAIVPDEELFHDYGW